MSSVRLVGITVSRGDRLVLDGVDLAVDDGERVALLGPSGSGKTTLLRVVAGAQHPDAGRVLLDGVDVTDVAPRHRDIAMVTQEDGLQPHLDVRSNLAFALRIRGTDPLEVRERVDAEARAFSLRDVLGRRPRTLSDGRRHEVALARSLVRRASVLLADEPLALIDPPRRSVLLRELITVQEGYGLTMLVATNDQHLASTVARRVAVLQGGRVVQAGPFEELYRHPATTFVAAFLGEPAMNLLAGELRRDAGPARLVAADLEMPSWDLGLSACPTQAVTLGLRPTALSLATDGNAVGSGLRGEVRVREFLGHALAVTVTSAAGGLVVVVPRPGPAVGEHVRVAVSPADVHVFDTAGRALAHGV